MKAVRRAKRGQPIGVGDPLEDGRALGIQDWKWGETPQHTQEGRGQPSTKDPSTQPWGFPS